MRPVRKGGSPIAGDFNKYEDAKVDLMSRLGRYCSYCERKIDTQLAVEHIEPKDGKFGRPDLENRWSNFLLACVNCNSCKSSKKVNFSRLLFPDRDNTFYAYVYNADGNISVSGNLLPRQQVMARNTLRLVGLDKSKQIYKDSNGEEVALDRCAQRMEVFGIAQVAFSLFLKNPNNNELKKLVAMNAVANGFFSIWMTVFDNHPDMKVMLIQAFKGTEASGCFNIQNGAVYTPAPNPDRLAGGGSV
ncbi:HNH endonuclease [Aeromonas veronii]|uniref:HNH endonuclease n=1 Tax=Aeromonas veronii TaxID=654 RepID=UPI003F747BD5